MDNFGMSKGVFNTFAKFCKSMTLPSLRRCVVGTLILTIASVALYRSIERPKYIQYKLTEKTKSRMSVLNMLYYSSVQDNQEEQHLLSSAMKTNQLHVTKEPLTSDERVEEQTNNIQWTPGKIYCVHDEGPIESKLRRYNSYMEKLRDKILRTASGKRSTSNIKMPSETIWGTRTNFIQQVMALPGVTTIVLPWEKASKDNLPIVRYYAWMADHDIYSILAKYFGGLEGYWITSRAPINQTINASPFSEPSLAMRPWNFEIPENSGNIVPENTCMEYNTFISLMENALVTRLGIIVAGGKTIQPFAHYGMTGNAVKTTNVTAFREVFVITQRFATHFYHRNVDMVPRLAPYLQFLKRYKQVYIHIGHAPYPELLFEIIGLPRSRFIRGDVEADLLYFPEPSYIFSPIPLAVQLISAKYREEIKKRSGGQRPDTVVLIKRTNKKRTIINHQHLMDVIMNMTKQHGLRFVEFSDEVAISYNESLKLFHRAVMVIGPHGAGFTNLLYCEPGVFVIEIFCEPPKTFLSIPQLTYRLGHHYYGLSSAGQNCPDTIKAPLTKFHSLLETIMPYVVKQFAS